MTEKQEERKYQAALEILRMDQHGEVTDFRHVDEAEQMAELIESKRVFEHAMAAICSDCACSSLLTRAKSLATLKELKLIRSSATL